MGRGLVATKIEQFIAVAQDALPLFFKEGFQLGNVLQDDGYRDIPRTHGGQQLVEVIRQAHVRKFIHEKVHRHRQASPVLVVGQMEQLLENLGVQDGHQEIEAGVVIGNQGEQGHFFLSQAGQIQLVCGGEGGEGSEIELFQPGCQGNLDGFQSLGGARAVIPVILHGDVVGLFHLQPVEQLVHRGLVLLVLLPHLRRPEQFHHHGEVLFLGQGFVLEVQYKGHEQHGGRCVPKRVAGLAVLGGGRLKQVGHQPLDVVVVPQVDKGVVAEALLHIEQIQHTDLIAFLLQQVAGIPEQLPLGVQNNKTGVGLAEIGLGVETCLACT